MLKWMVMAFAMSAYGAGRVIVKQTEEIRRLKEEMETVGKKMEEVEDDIMHRLCGINAVTTQLLVVKSLSPVFMTADECSEAGTKLMKEVDQIAGRCGTIAYLSDRLIDHD